MAGIIALTLWVITAVVGIINILYIQSMVLRTFYRFVPSGTGDTLINSVVVVVLAILWVGIAIGGAEYHRTRVGTAQSWRAFSRVLAVEFSILVMPLFV